MNPILCPEKEFWAWFSVPNADAYDGLSPTDTTQPQLLWGLKPGGGCSLGWESSASLTAFRQGFGIKTCSAVH